MNWKPWRKGNRVDSKGAQVEQPARAARGELPQEETPREPLPELASLPVQVYQNDGNTIVILMMGSVFNKVERFKLADMRSLDMTLGDWVLAVKRRFAQPETKKRKPKRRKKR